MGKEFAAPRQGRSRPLGRQAAALLSEQLRSQLSSDKRQFDGDLALRNAILETLPQMVWSVGADGEVDYYNDHVLEFTGVDLRAGGSGAWRDLIHPDDQERTWLLWSQCMATGELYEIEHRFRHRSGQYRWILCRALPVRDADGVPHSWIGTCTDIHDQKIAQEALHNSAILTRNVIEASLDIMILLDAAGYVIFANGTAWRAAMLKQPAACGEVPWQRFIPPSVHGQLETAIKAAQGGEAVRVQVRERLPDGPYVWWDVAATPVLSDEGECRQILLVARDITESRDQTEQIRWAASHDALTELANRRTFNAALAELPGANRSEGLSGAVVLIDLDHFKTVNDTLGHDAGDLLLKAVAERLRDAVRDCDIVARLGGDEFAIILQDIDSEEMAVAIMEAIIAKLHLPYEHKAGSMDCFVSTGMALYPKHGRTAKEILKSADVALYSAKAAGRGRLKVFRPEMRSEINKRRAMIGAAQRALREDGIVPFYQPKIELNGGATVGFEALLRLPHADGINMPAVLASAFEDPLLATRIGEQIQNKVFADMRRWLDEGHDFGNVAINVADAEFRDDDLANKLLERLHRFDIPASLLTLEITETAFIGKGTKDVERELNLLSSAGVRIALDDFGTGYASLTHLSRFPVNEIKIDQSFVRDVHNSNAAAIVRALVKLGQSLDVAVVAEGIETEAQADFLRYEGCTVGQGHLFAKALPAAEVPSLLVLGTSGDRRSPARPLN